MNPFIEEDAGYNVTDDYPRATVEDYRHKVESSLREPAIVARAQFELDEDGRQRRSGPRG